MKNKSTLMLLELIVMFLVFAIAAALCLKAFAISDSISKENLARDEAVVLAQNAAELLKHNHGDISDVEESLKHAALASGCDLHITSLENSSSYFGEAEIAVVYKGEIIFSITAAWQEVTGNE